MNLVNDGIFTDFEAAYQRVLALETEKVAGPVPGTWTMNGKQRVYQDPESRKDMSIKPDHWIRRMALEHGMIEPFVDGQVNEGVVSYGLSSYGYDMRVADEFRVFRSPQDHLRTIIDPKQFSSHLLEEIKGESCTIPPNSFALARSVERFHVPRSVLCVTVGKSTYARCGVIVTVTPLEPEWEGYITIEISNTSQMPAMIYANEGIAQVLFFESNEDCELSYADRKGKYQHQTGITLPRVP
jgi:dCTP deaminase